MGFGLPIGTYEVTWARTLRLPCGHTGISRSEVEVCCITADQRCFREPGVAMWSGAPTRCPICCATVWGTSSLSAAYVERAVPTLRPLSLVSGDAVMRAPAPPDTPASVAVFGAAAVRSLSSAARNVVGAVRGASCGPPRRRSLPPSSPVRPCEPQGALQQHPASPARALVPGESHRPAHAAVKDFQRANVDCNDCVPTDGDHDGPGVAPRKRPRRGPHVG